MKEEEVFNIIEQCLHNIFKEKQKPIRIAVNGIEGTGKTTFAEKLKKYLEFRHKKSIHVSIDGFHFNKKYRYRQGRDSAKGYYEDSYDELGFVEKVLLASQSDEPKITIASHDLNTDEYLNLEPIKISNNCVLITDGAYLFKPNYINYWDLKIYLKTDFNTALLRGVKRDLKLLGGLKAAKDKYNNRYHKASKMYIEENQPEKKADLIIDNTDFDNLIVIKN